ncbi:hypothetical protein EPN15_02975 [Patescibacteria group bacterium]|nr:MAG: hypothetical protein EPN15_02975 [Patescibacteria group bacterium]
MNKLLAITLALAAILFVAGPAMAEIDSESDSTAEANVAINTTTIDNSRNLPQIMTPTKLDGSFVTTPALYYDPKIGDSFSEDALPQAYRIEGWKIFYSAPYDSGVKVRRIKTERKSWIKDQESLTGERVNSDSEALGDNEELIALPYYPENAREVAISKVFLDKENYIINQAVSEAWYHAWEKSIGAKYYIILYNSRLVSQASVRALGSAVVTGSSVDPQSVNNSSVNALSAGGGVGFGSARAHVYKEPAFMVIAFSDKGNAPRKLSKKPEPPKELTVNVKPEKEEAKIEIKEEEIFPMVEFEFDKFKIMTEEQKKPIRMAAKKTAENWDKMKKENMQIFIVGSCSPEGTVKYNDVLGRKRSQEVYNLFASILIDAYGIPENEVKERIKFVSAGKNNPEFDEIVKQRNAAFFIAAKLKTKKE